MNLPVGEVISRGVSLDVESVKKLIFGFFDKKFSGYLVATVDGYSGVEEGVLLFKNGVIIGAIYDYDSHGLSVFGDKALLHVFNSFAAKYVIADVVSLTEQQVDLVLAFNDKSKINRRVDKLSLGKLIPKEYSIEYAKNVIKESKDSNKSKIDLFNKFGLGQLSD